MLIEAAALPPLAERRQRRGLSPAMRRAATTTRRELERLIEARGLEGRVRIVGHCEDAPAALALADVAVIASTEPEAFGRTAVEAAAMGVPVVATALGATGGDRAGAARRPARRANRLAGPARATRRACAAAIGEALALSPPSGRRSRRSARAAMPGDLRHAKMQQATLALYDRLLSRGRSRRRSFLETISASVELTCRRIRRILHFAVAASAGAAYVYPSATE